MLDREQFRRERRIRNKRKAAARKARRQGQRG